jgi:hypothetical protein
LARGIRRKAKQERLAREYLEHARTGKKRRVRIPAAEFRAMRARWKDEWNAMSVQDQRPYVVAVQRAQEQRRLQARAQLLAPPLPPPAEGLFVARNDSLWQCGNKASFVAPRTLREFAAGVRWFRQWFRIEHGSDEAGDRGAYVGTLVVPVGRGFVSSPRSPFMCNRLVGNAVAAFVAAVLHSATRPRPSGRL